MVEQTENLVLELLRVMRTEMGEIRHDVSELRSETNLKIGTLAESMVSMRKEINGLESAVQGMRADVRMIALAVDEHTHRLDKMDTHTPIPNA